MYNSKKNINLEKTNTTLLIQIVKKKKERKKKVRKTLLYKSAIMNRKIFFISDNHVMYYNSYSSLSFNSHTENQVCATGEDEIMEWNYDRANENNISVVHIPHDVDTPS